MSLVLLKYTNKSYDSVFFFFHKVVLPSLHMSLGIFKKIYDMFEAECHKIDLKLFQLRVQHAYEEELMSNNFDQRVAGEFQKQQQLTTDIAEKKKNWSRLKMTCRSISSNRTYLKQTRCSVRWPIGHIPFDKKLKSW